MNISHDLRNEYVVRINRVLDYIECHLEEEMTLEELAGVAHFSPYHFHRIFSAMTGETIGKFIQRLRLERAAMQLKMNRAKSITEIALDNGFSGSAPFSRMFRDMFGMSPRQWRSGESKNGMTDRNHGQTDGKKRKDIEVTSRYVIGVTHSLTWRMTMEGKTIDVRIDELPPMPVAYVRHTGPYKGDSALFEGMFTRLMTWAGPRGLLAQPNLTVMAVYHDDPEITAEGKQRVSMCLTIPENTEVSGEIGKMIVPGGNYAAARFALLPHEYGEAWSALCGEWLPASGYQPDDRPALEIYRNDPKEHPEGRCIVDICLPVKPL